MANRYINDNGSMDYDKAWRTLADLNDGYFGSVEGVSYQNASSVDGGSGFLGMVESGNDGDVDPEILGSRLLRTVSEICGLLTDIRHGNVEEEHGLHLMEKHAVMASKLSDQYSMKDSHYHEHWNSDVLNICEAIQESDVF